MSAATSTIALPEDLLRDISQQASVEGIPAEKWISNALSERIRLQRQTDEFFRLRAARASGRKLGEILDTGGYAGREPDPGDEL